MSREPYFFYYYYYYYILHYTTSDNSTSSVVVLLLLLLFFRQACKTLSPRSLVRTPRNRLSDAGLASLASQQGRRTHLGRRQKNDSDRKQAQGRKIYRLV